MQRMIEHASHDCVSDEALSHLKSYKYSSVDRSLLSHYLLNPYVRRSQVKDWNERADKNQVECFREALANMARTEHGDSARVLFHCGQRHIA